MVHEAAPEDFLTRASFERRPPFVRLPLMCSPVRVPLLAVAAMLLFVSIVSAVGQGSPNAPRRGGNPEAAKIRNPVPPTPESLAAGKRAYGQLCASCHGASGKGDGSGAGAGAQPADLTDAVWDYGSSDGEIFTVIHDGTSQDMGSYSARLKDAEIWNVVNYIKTLGKTQNQ
jgi:mono/diheme cytochrome c family protein